MRNTFQRLALVAITAAGGAACENPGAPSTDQTGPPDGIAPKVELTAPGNGAMSSSSGKVYIIATLTDSVGVARATYSVDGGAEQPLQVTPGTTANVNTEVVVPEGTHTVTVHAYDAAGNRGSGPARQVARGPSFLGRFVLVTVADGQLVEATSAQVVLKIFGDVSQLAQATFSLNGGADAAFTPREHHGASWREAGVTLLEGENTLAVRVTDTSGKSETRSLRVRFRERVSFNSLEDRLVASDTVTLASDAAHSTGLVSASYRVSGGPEIPVPLAAVTFRPNTYSYRFTATLPAQGIHPIAVIVTDGRGRRDSVVVRVVRSRPASASGAFAEVAAGQSHTCAVTTAGKLLCWGSNDRGQLGDGATQQRRVPTAVSTSLSFRTVVVNRGGMAVSAGDGFSCALTTAGAAYCWGGNSLGQLGVNSPSLFSSEVPVAVSGGRSYTAITAGARHVCAVTADGATWCWGANDTGQLGNGTTRPTVGAGSQAVPATQVTGVALQSVAAAVSHTCGLAGDGTVYCWGANNAGQLGVADVAQSTTPVKRPGDLRFRAVATADEFSCGRTAGGEVYCWGGGATAPRLIGGGFTALSAGAARACGIRDGAPVCWGSSMAPAAIGSAEPLSLTAITVGGVDLEQYVCAVAANNAAYCQGSGSAGRLGNGTQASSSVLVRVTDP